MLKFLEIRQFALIEQLELEFQKGLNLLTGETGSGKSILVDALGLLLGDKGFIEMIRTGAEKALISALFDIPQDGRLREVFETSGLDFTPDELIIKREIASNGKSRAFINNQLVPVSFLKEVGQYLVDIHGQRGEQALYQEGEQREFLDAFAGVEDLRKEVCQFYGKYEEKRQQLLALKQGEQQRLRSIDLLTYQISEIEKAHLKSEDEDDLLAGEHRLLANADKLFQLSHTIFSELYDSESSVSTVIKHACRTLEELSRVDDRCREPLQELQSARIAIDDVALFLREYSSNVEVNPKRLEWVEARMAEIERLKRRYGHSVREILVFHHSSLSELEVLQKADESIPVLEKEQGELRETYWNRASELSARRKAAARALEKSVEKELAQLAMEKTRFRISFSEVYCPPAAAGNADSLRGRADGIDQIEFLISPNPGEDLRPLVKVASGGEISRIMLALKTVKSIDERGKTLVFDEVDAGIGGQTAAVVGQKLKRLSRRNQVVCVTHLPQVASYADSHFYIEKRVQKGRTVTHVKPLDHSARVQEIARMISGDRVTESVLNHAAELLKGCSNGGEKKQVDRT